MFGSGVDSRFSPVQTGSQSHNSAVSVSINHPGGGGGSLLEAHCEALKVSSRSDPECSTETGVCVSERHVPAEQFPGRHFLH